MSQSSVQLRVVASNDHEFARENLARAFRESMTEHLRFHTDGTNVNPATLLTTDYLNHFNEIIMALELAPDSPTEFADDLARWEHESYEEHFTHSGFRDKELAVVCYRNAPEDARRAFDSAVADLEQEMVLLLQKVRKKIDSGDAKGLAKLCEDSVPRLKDLAQTAAGIVNGPEPEKPGSKGKKKAKAKKPDVQAEVDALFK